MAADFEVSELFGVSQGRDIVPVFMREPLKLFQDVFPHTQIYRMERAAMSYIAKSPKKAQS